MEHQHHNNNDKFKNSDFSEDLKKKKNSSAPDFTQTLSGDSHIQPKNNNEEAAQAAWKKIAEDLLLKDTNENRTFKFEFEGSKGDKLEQARILLQDALLSQQNKDTAKEIIGQKKFEREEKLEQARILLQDAEIRRKNEDIAKQIEAHLRAKKEKENLEQ